MLREIRRHRFLFLLLPCLFVSCFESASDAVGNASTTSMDGVIETEVGTNVGNPTTPTKNSVMFITSTDVQDIDDVIVDVTVEETVAAPSTAVPAAGALPVASEDCMPILQPEKGFVSQRCRVTPSELHVGVLALWLTDCVDADGLSVFCHNKLATAVTQRIELFNGEPVDVVITSMGMGLEVNDISETITARGMQMVTTYIEFKLPDSDKIVSYLRGKSVRICTSPDAYAEAYCGTPGIKFGQTTFDIDGDGFPGYLDIATLTPDFAEETQTPPADNKYSEFSDSFLYGFKNGTTGYYPFTDTDFYDVAGFYAPLIPTFSPQEISKETSLKFTLSFDNTGVTKFMDGMMSYLLGLPTCVEGVAPGKTLCNGTTSDEGSFGTYNPFYDAGLYNDSPKVEFLIE